MQRGCLLLIATGCGFHGAAASPDAQVPVGGIPEMHPFDLPALQAGQALSMTVDAARNSLTPDAYIYGGLAAHGVQGTKLWMDGDTDWSKQAAVAATGAALWRGEQVSTSDDLRYLGISDPQAGMSLWLEGEVWLDAGAAEGFNLTADEVAFIDLAAPGTASFTRAAQSLAAVSVDTPMSGWYPIRIGYANGSTAGVFSFQHSDALGVAPASWTRDRLRARASQMSGVMRTVCDHLMLAGGTLAAGAVPARPPVVHVEDGDLMPDNTFPAAPQGAETDNNQWSARYAGQVYITAPGTYVLTATSDDGNRVRLADKTGDANWTGNINPGTTTVTAALVAGWNDVVVDYEQNGGDRDLRVQLKGPDGAAVAIPHDQLRPVEPSIDRLVYGTYDTAQRIQDNDPNNPGVMPIPIAAYPGEMVRAIDMVFFLDSAKSETLKAELVPPSGPKVQVWQGDGGVSDRLGAQVDILPSANGAPATLLGGPAAGVWTLRVTDTNNGGNNSSLLAAKLTLHTSGGPDKVARTATWISAPIDAMTPVIAIDGITWSARTPAGTAAKVEYRACQQADCSDEPEWSDGVAMATSYRVEPARYLQLRVELTSDGTVEPELTSLAVGFRHQSI